MSDTPIADMVEQMLSAEMSADMVVLAVRTAERMALSIPSGGVTTDETANRRRERDRIRKAEVRAGVRRLSADISQLTPSLTKVEKIDSIEISKKESKKVRKKEGRSVSADSPRTKRRLPPDWVPSADDLAYAATMGFSEKAALLMGESFRDHHCHKGTLGLNWALGWKMWVRNELKFTAQRGGGRQSQSAAASFFGEAMGGARGEK